MKGTLSKARFINNVNELLNGTEFRKVKKINNN